MKRRRFSSLLGGAALASLTGVPAHAETPEGCGVPGPREDGWTVVSVDHDKLIDRAALCQATDRLVAAGANIHSLVVARGGQLVFERYFMGLDEVPAGFIVFGRRVAKVAFDAETSHDVKSASKCVASLTFGIAIDQGLIRSLDEPIFSFFPELADLRTPEKDRILLRHVLDMTLGLAWEEATPTTGDFANDEARMHMARDQCRFVLGLPVIAPAGQEFHYNTGALALMSAVVRKATGRPLDEFARANLFDPLGIRAPDWRRWGGDTDAGGGLRLRPREMAKIGQLVLAGGEWNNRQIISRDWIETSTTPKVEAVEDGFDGSYGYLWWLGRSLINRREVNWIGALGRGGQSIRIVPELDLVVVVTAGYYQDYSPRAGSIAFSVFRDAVRAALPRTPASQ